VALISAGTWFWIEDRRKDARRRHGNGWKPRAGRDTLVAAHGPGARRVGHDRPSRHRVAAPARGLRPGADTAQQPEPRAQPGRPARSAGRRGSGGASLHPVRARRYRCPLPLRRALSPKPLPQGTAGPAGGCLPPVAPGDGALPGAVRPPGSPGPPEPAGGRAGRGRCLGAAPPAGAGSGDEGAPPFPRVARAGPGRPAQCFAAPAPARGRAPAGAQADRLRQQRHDHRPAARAAPREAGSQ